jgi:hypothetical protein
MKIILPSTLFIASLLSLNVPASAADSKQPATDSPWKAELEKLRAENKVKEQEVLKAAKELTAAMAARNVAALDKMLSADYVEDFEEDVMTWNGKFVNLPTPPKKVPGRKRTKQDLLAGLKSGTLKISSLQTTNEEVKIQNNVAVIGGALVVFAARIVEKSSTNGKDTSGEFFITRNYSKEGGNWVCVGASLNPLIPAK